MRKKYTITIVRNLFKEKGWELLDNEYINMKYKLNYICSKGHKHKITLDKFLQGCGCPYCAGVNKPTIKEVRQSFTKKGYILLSTEYINAHSKLDFICPKGHKHSINYHNWLNNRECPYCKHKIKLSIDLVRESFESEGYILLSKKYKNGRTKLDFICGRGHKHSISWDNWNHTKKYRCFYCWVEKNNGAGASNWRGGISKDPYCDVFKDKNYRNYIKERDNFVCRNPYCFKDSNVLVLHHIDYDKQNNHPSNLITVCRNCNFRANYSREWHTEWYQTLMKKRGY